MMLLGSRLSTKVYVWLLSACAMKEMREISQRTLTLRAPSRLSTLRGFDSRERASVCSVA
jgi:hypothetical protein